MKDSNPDGLRNALLLFISKGRRNGAYINDMLSYGDYDSVQYALMWLEGKGLVSADHLKEIGNHHDDVLRATITIDGMEYIDNEFSFPVQKVAVTLDEGQLERIIIGMANKFGKPEDSSRIKKFIEKTGNAGVNALATESVKYMITHLPEIAKGLM